MRSIEKISERLKEQYVRLFAWFYHSPIEDQGKVELESGEEIEVYWFSEESGAFGQNVLFANTIILNRELFDRLPSAAIETVIQHERSHQQRPPVIQGSWLGLVLAGFAVGISLSLYAGIFLLLGAHTSAVITAEIIGIVMTSVAGILWRAEESLADLDAIHAVGEERFIQGYEAIDSVSEGGIVDAILRRLFYNSPESTRKLYHRLQNFGFYAD